jgi:DNA-binding YbaB/EbfC family protein
MDISQLGKMLEQAQQVKSQMDEKLAAIIVEGSSGGGAVTVRMNGKKELLKLTIAPAAASAAAGDITMLEDLILAAIHEATRKATEAETTHASSMLGGLGLPGF